MLRYSSGVGQDQQSTGLPSKPSHWNRTPKRTLNWVASSSISTNRFFDHVYLSIPKSIQALLDMLPGGASSIKVRSTPGNHLVTLSKAMCIPEEDRYAQDLDMQSLYRSAVGLLIWIQQTVRYDISYPTQRLASFLSILVRITSKLWYGWLVISKVLCCVVSNTHLVEILKFLVT